jgi:hypothetical protein
MKNMTRVVLCKNDQEIYSSELICQITRLIYVTNQIHEVDATQWWNCRIAMIKRQKFPPQSHNRINSRTSNSLQLPQLFHSDFFAF